MDKQRVGDIMLWMVIGPAIIIGAIGIGIGIMEVPIPTLTVLGLAAFVVVGAILSKG